MDLNHISTHDEYSNTSRSNLTTLQPPHELTGSTLKWFQVLQPIICSMGICGNLLTIVILTHKRFCARMAKLEQCANLGMIALAWSDLLFCITVLPHSFVDHHSDQSTSTFGLYYRVYGISLINTFIMSSTWLLVVLSADRFMVLFCPFQAAATLTPRRNIVVIIVVCVLCFLLTFPYFIHKEVRGCMSLVDGESHHEIYLRYPRSSPWTVFLEVYILHVWPVIAVFLPQSTLFVCNVKLIQGLHHIKKSHLIKCPRQKLHNSNTRITMTLIIVVALAIALVTPAEILKALNPYMLWADTGHILAAVANLLQTFYFSFNFVLYCVIDKHFRHICHELFIGACGTQTAQDEQFSLTNRRSTETSFMIVNGSVI